MKATGFLGVFMLFLLSIAEATFEWGACSDYGRDSTGMEFFNTQQFAGKWYQLAKDKDEAFFSGATCILDTYTIFGRTDLERTQTFVYLNLFQWVDIFPKMISYSKLARKRYISHIPFLWETQHDILATDYSNYAVVYGCTNRLFSLYHEYQATLLSKPKHLGAASVRDAKHALKKVNYDYKTMWDKAAFLESTPDCTLSYEDTQDMAFIEMLKMQPDWDRYPGTSYSNNNQRMRSLFDGNTGKYPAGNLIDGVSYKGVQLSTPVAQQVESSFYQEYFILKNITVHHEHELNPAQFDASYEALADIWLLTEDLQDSEVKELMWVQDEMVNRSVCCLEYSVTMLDDDSTVDLEWLLNGHARVIYHGSRGVEKLKEGRFVHGRMVDFGRFMTIENGDYEYTYVGWIPDENEIGKGIAVVDQTQISQGQYSPEKYFSEDDSYLSEPTKNFIVTSFDSRS